MKKVVRYYLDEINSTVLLVKKPMTRKGYLSAKKWYLFQKESLQKENYKGKISRLPKHIEK